MIRRWGDIPALYAKPSVRQRKVRVEQIVQDQTNDNPYTDPQELTKKGPMRYLGKSFNDWVMFHLLTVFPNSTSEQERYYITNILKKPRRVSIFQFMQCVEKLNSYISKLPCWYYNK